MAADDTEQSLLPRVAPILLPHGFSTLWFSNDWVQLFDADDAGVIATHFPGGALAIDIAAASGPRLQALREPLWRDLGLKHLISSSTGSSRLEPPSRRQSD